MQIEIKDLIVSSNPDILLILESRIKSNNIHVIANGIFPRNWNNYSNVAHASSARIWIAWRNDIDLRIHHMSAQVILCDIGIPSVSDNVCLAATYGYNNPSFRVNLWEFIQSISAQLNEPFIFVGDFNRIRGSDENRVEGG